MILPIANTYSSADSPRMMNFKIRERVVLAFSISLQIRRCRKRKVACNKVFKQVLNGVNSDIHGKVWKTKWQSQADQK